MSIFSKYNDEILELLQKGLSNREISGRFCLSKPLDLENTLQKLKIIRGF